MSVSRLANCFSIIDKMKLFKYLKRVPFSFITIPYILGLLLGQFQLPIQIVFIFYFIGFLFLLRQEDRAFISGLIIILLSIGWSSMFIQTNDVNGKRNIAIDLDQSDVKVRSLIKNKELTKKGVKYSLEFNGIDVWFFTKEDIHAEIGDSLIGTGTFTKLEPPRNPGEFDFQSHFNHQGIFGWIFAHKKIKTQIIPNDSFSFHRLVYNVRSTIRDQFQSVSSGVGGDLLSALILGDKSEVDPSITEDFAKTGVIHVLAVSGLHVGYVLIILLIIKNIFGLPWGWDRIVVILGLTAFVILTGFKPSVVRASVMAGLYVLAPVFDRQVNIWNIILFTALIILIIDPMALFQLGFQLSFIAVISIIYFYNWLNIQLPDNLKVSKIENKSVQFVWGLFLVSLSAQIGTLPFTSYYFGKIPIIALIANVFIVPLIGLLVGIGFMILFLGWIPFVGSALGESAWLLSMVITHSTSFFSNIPFSNIEFGFTFIHMFTFFSLIISFILYFHDRKGLSIMILFLVGNTMIWKWSLSEDQLDVVFMDVGQGDAALVILPNDETILIDAGQRNMHEDMGKDVVLPVLNHFGVQELNWVIMSHPHSDHIGGLVTVMNNIRIMNLVDSYIDYESWTYKSIIDHAQNNGIKTHRFPQGHTMKFGNNILIEYFAPDSVFAVSEHNVNNGSIVFKLTYGETSFLFTGDLEHEGDDLLIPFEEYLKSDVLKVAHHGSITSSTESFIDFVQPEIAVISVGKNNKYDHPSSTVLNRLIQRKIDIHRTDIEGALWLRSDGRSIKEIQWK